MIFVTGDLHGDFSPLYEFAKSEEGRVLSKRDFVIVLGDFGIWHETIEDIKKIDLELPFSVMFLDGNHEKFPLLNSMPEKKVFGGRSHDVYGVLHLCRGEIFVIPNGDKNTKIAVCGGGDSRDKEFRKVGVDWFPEESITKADVERMFIKAIENNMMVDYFLSHSPSSFVKAELLTERQIYKHEEQELSQSECYIRNIVGFLFAREYYCGHEHIDRDFCVDCKKYILVSERFIKLT